MQMMEVCRRSGSGVGAVAGADYGVAGVVAPAAAPSAHHLALTINQQRLRAAPYDNLVSRPTVVYNLHIIWPQSKTGADKLV